MRLSIDNRAPATYELIEDELAIGRVEVCNGTNFVPVCKDIWSNEEASVFCLQLGYSPFGEPFFYTYIFMEVSTFYAFCVHVLTTSHTNNSVRILIK